MFCWPSCFAGAVSVALLFCIAIGIHDAESRKHFEQEAFIHRAGQYKVYTTQFSVEPRVRFFWNDELTNHP